MTVVNSEPVYDLAVVSAARLGQLVCRHDDVEDLMFRHGLEFDHNGLLCKKDYTLITHIKTESDFDNGSSSTLPTSEKSTDKHLQLHTKEQSEDNLANFAHLHESDSLTGIGDDVPIQPSLSKKRKWSPDDTTNVDNSELEGEQLDLRQTLRAQNNLKLIERTKAFVQQPFSSYRSAQIREIVGKVGLKKKGTDFELFHRLQRIAETDDLNAMMRSEECYQWFCRSARGEVPRDKLGAYAFQPKRLPKYYTIPHEKLRPIAELIGITEAQIKEYDAVGSINLTNFFRWWKNDGIYDIMLEELEMYRWHLHSDKKGWLRDCYYSLAQQAMRMDIRYWMAYTLFRPDHRAWLISYPYYCKYTTPGEQTFFRHIDLNVDQMASEGRGINQIQGTVSLDQEHYDDCTEIVPGLHKAEYLSEWARRWISRGGPQGHIHGIDDKLLTKQDLKDFGDTQWTAVPCKPLSARIKHPALAHGAKGPATHVRRTLLPWFVGIEEDHHHLEVRESGTWKELAEAHRDMMHGPSSPSGWPNKYPPITFPFPAAVHLQVTNPISQALVGRREWGGQTGVYLDRLLSEPGLIKEYQDDLAHSIKIAWEQVKSLEKAAYGSKSFFNREEGAVPPKHDFPTE